MRRREQFDPDLCVGIALRAFAMMIVVGTVAFPVLSAAVGVDGVDPRFARWPGWLVLALTFWLTFESVIGSTMRAEVTQKKRDGVKAAEKEVVRLAERIALEARDE